MLRHLLTGLLVVAAAAHGFAQEKKDDKKEKLPTELYPLAKGTKQGQRISNC
jgi:hypothetical protein